MRKLFLDDMRDPPDCTWDVVRTFAAFVAYIDKYGVPDEISFDHDLGDEHYAVVNPDAKDYGRFTEKTGYDCAKWLVEHGLLPARYTVHSMNQIGAANIRFVMEAAYRRGN